MGSSNIDRLGAPRCNARSELASRSFTHCGHLTGTCLAIAPLGDSSPRVRLSLPRGERRSGGRVRDGEGGSMRILVVDEDEMSRETIAEVLRQEGHEVVGMALSSLESECAAGRFDLVLKDLSFADARSEALRNRGGTQRDVGREPNAHSRDNGHDPREAQRSRGRHRAVRHPREAVRHQRAARSDRSSERTHAGCISRRPPAALHARAQRHAVARKIFAVSQEHAARIADASPSRRRGRTAPCLVSVTCRCSRPRAPRVPRSSFGSPKE